MKVFLDSIGCRLNQSEIEEYANQFHAAGHQLVSSIDEADMVIINTCAVTMAASSDSRQKLRKAVMDRNIRVVGTGCLTTLEPELFRIASNYSSIPNSEKDDLVKTILGELPEEISIKKMPLQGKRKRTRAFIKVQDGCDNYCTYCVTRLARGKARSVEKPIVLNDIQSALENGVKEIVLSGVNLGSWGSDMENQTPFSDLIHEILAIQKDFRLRLSSIEPWDITGDFFRPWLSDNRMCRHFHLPLQSGSSMILKRMARNTTPEKYSRLVDEIRSLMPDATITTDVIVGFPGETGEYHLESLDFVKKIGFDAGHIFTFSPRQGTPAANYPEPVDPVEKKSRSEQMRAVISQSGKERRQQMIDQVVPVLWEGIRKSGEKQWNVAGLTPNNFRVRTRVDFNITNQVTLTKLISVTEDGFLGEIIRQ